MQPKTFVSIAYSYGGGSSSSSGESAKDHVCNTKFPQKQEEATAQEGAVVEVMPLEDRDQDQSADEVEAMDRRSSPEDLLE